MKKVKLTYEAIVDLDFMIDKDTLKSEFNNDINEFAKWLDENEGLWLDVCDYKFIKAEIFETEESNKRGNKDDRL